MNNPFDLTGKRALLTGGTRGLGKDMAEGLLEQGTNLVIWGTNEKVHAVAKEFCDKGYQCQGLVVDLADRTARTEGFAKSLELLGGGIDILVNVAGIQRRYPCEEFPLDDWDAVIEVNQTAPFHLCQLAAKDMMTHGGGKIINVASMLSFFGGQTVPAYAASKGAVAQFTKAMCNEWASKNIQVNALAPGYMDTDMNTALTDPENPRFKEITGRIPAQRWGNGQDMKGPCLFLASSASDYLSGAIIPVDGGYLVK
ncbi:SDR family NAD(P)-dependent oxidoreductase [Bengtsoniella intestinalis]|uniref:SDR family NAD(P)-dependent oxidoreductase n=1 Tax=Bengtsoniella intestinalis TaxID=3073143 RepID=UPI00391F4CD1